MRRKPAIIMAAGALDPDATHPLTVPVTADEAIEPLEQMFFSDAGGALRTLLGASHHHMIGVLPSLKTGLNNPFEGLGEQALACESEIDADVDDFQTQAFRLRMMVDGCRTEWICDHLRQLRSGEVEAIEVKQHPSQMDAHYLRKMTEARRILSGIGWKVHIRYERAIVGCPAREVNRSDLMQDRSVHVGEDGLAAVERLRTASATTTFGRLRRALDHRRVAGEAKARAVLAAGLARTDLDRLIEDESPIDLLSASRLASRIRF